MRNWSSAVMRTLFVGIYSSACAQAKFDPNDLSGIWQITKEQRSISADATPMTPEGEARLNANKPTRGRFLGEPLNGQQKLLAPLRFVFNRMLAESPQARQRVFERLAVALSRVRVRNLMRPDAVWSLDELTERVEQDFLQ